MENITALENIPHADTSADGLNNILNWVIAAAGMIATGIIIYGAIKFLTGQGQPEKIRQAKQIIAYAVIGLVVVALAFAIVNFVFNMAGDAAKTSSDTSAIVTAIGGIA